MPEFAPSAVASGKNGLYLIPGARSDAARKLATMGAVAAALGKRPLADLLGGLPDIATPDDPAPGPASYAAYAKGLGRPVVFMALRDPADVAAACAMAKVATVVARLFAEPSEEGASARVLALNPYLEKEFGAVFRGLVAAGETWPPMGGLPRKSRMIRAKDLRWGMTPYDGLTRAELLRLVQAHHMALSSCHSLLKQSRMGQEAHPFWGDDGTGGRAMAMADALMGLSGAHGGDRDRERIYRRFFRVAKGLLFPELVAKGGFDEWGVNDKGEWCAPTPGPERGFRPVEWRDLHPSADLDSD